MAPVGRWQQGKDLSWYARAGEDDGGDSARKAEEERAEEIRRVKEAEQDALSRALGLPVAPKTKNANMTPLGGKHVEMAIKETADDDDGEEQGARGVGFGVFGGTPGMDKGTSGERIEAVGVDPTAARKSHRSSRREKRGRSRSRDGDRRRARSRDRHGEKDRLRRDYERHHQERRPKSRSGDRERRRRRSRSRSRSRDRKREHGRERHHRRERTDRSHSPDDRRDRHRYSRERHGDYRRR